MYSRKLYDLGVLQYRHKTVKLSRYLGISGQPSYRKVLVGVIVGYSWTRMEMNVGIRLCAFKQSTLSINVTEKFIELCLRFARKGIMGE